MHLNHLQTTLPLPARGKSIFPEMGPGTKKVGD